MATEPRQLQAENQHVGGLETLTAEERAAIEACLDLHEHPDTYAEKAWRFVKPWLMKEPIKNVPGKRGQERLDALREQRRQLFQAIDRVRGGDVKQYIGRRQLERFQTTIKDETYTFVAPLGAGGFGTTFDAWQDSTNRECVVKCMEVDQGNVIESRKAIVEVAVLRKLNGLHAPKLLDAQFQHHPTDKNHRMLVAAMEKVGGENGLEAVYKYGTDQTDVILQRVHTLLRAVQDIHQAGVLHLDLKPEHLFFSEDGQDVTFIDFGLAHMPELSEKQLQGTRATSPRYGVVPEGSKLGTASYAPEDYSYTPKFDSYSVGRIIQTFLYKEKGFAVEDRVPEFSKLSEPMKQLSRLAERMTTRNSEQRLDMRAAISEFTALFAQFAQPEVATAQTA